MSNKAMNTVQEQEATGSRRTGEQVPKAPEPVLASVPAIGTASAEHPHPAQGEWRWAEQRAYWDRQWESVLREIAQNRERADRQWESVLREIVQNREYADKRFEDMNKRFADMQKHSAIFITTLVAVAGIVAAVFMNSF